MSALEKIKELFHEKPLVAWGLVGAVAAGAALMLRGRSGTTTIVPGPVPVKPPSPLTGGGGGGSSGSPPPPDMVGPVRDMLAAFNKQQMDFMGQWSAQQKAANAALTAQMAAYKEAYKQAPPSATTEGTHQTSSNTPPSSAPTYSAPVPGTDITATGPTQAAADYGAKLLSMPEPKNTAPDMPPGPPPGPPPGSTGPI